MEGDLLSLAERRLKHWNHRMTLWYVMYYGLGSLSIFLTVTVASRPYFIDTDWLTTVAWLAAIFQGLTTFLFALPKAIAYTQRGEPSGLL